MRFTDSSYDSERLSTIGIDFKRAIVKFEGEDINVQIWDTAGQERFHTITAGTLNSRLLPFRHLF